MMPRITFTAPLFSRDLSVEDSQKILKLLLRALTAVNVAILKKHPEIPSIFAAGVRYVPEHNRELWQDVLYTRRVGGGDCEDLASWFAAELRVRKGIMAMPTVTVRRIGSRTIYHALVKLPDGRLVDPSRKLGMGSQPGTLEPYNTIEVDT